MTFPIAATAGYVSRVAERDHTAVVASLRPFFEARSVVVVGASSRRGTIGGELFRNVLAGEFAAPHTPSTETASPSGVFAATARSPRSPIRSTLPSSASRPLRCSRRWSPPSQQACARSA